MCKKILFFKKRKVFFMKKKIKTKEEDFNIKPNKLSHYEFVDLLEKYKIIEQLEDFYERTNFEKKVMK